MRNPWRLRLPLAASILAVAGCAASLASPAFAQEPSPPEISWLGVRIGAQIEVGAGIDPEGLQTSYLIRVECKGEGTISECEPLAHAPSGEAQMLPSYVFQEVWLDVTGLEPGAYWFGVTAKNAGGEKFRRSTLRVPTPLPLPENKITPYEPQPPPWADESGRLAAERTVAEQRAREERERAAQQAAGSGPAHPAGGCVVPNLIGHTLAGARRLLTHAHCKLGRVTLPHPSHGQLRIVGQRPARGTRLVSDGKVSVRLRR